jgi:hypothetical protein
MNESSPVASSPYGAGVSDDRDGGRVTVLVTEAGSVHAVTSAGRWRKLTSVRGPIRAGWGGGQMADVLAVPVSAIEASETLNDALGHPDARRGVENIQVGDRAYLATRDEWTLTTPVVRVLSGVFTEEASGAADEVFIIAAARAAWILESRMLVSLTTEERSPAPPHLGVGDCVQGEHYVIRAAGVTAPS